MEINKYPARQCIGCRRVQRKEDLLRFVRTPVGRMDFDVSGMKQGRGYYLCPNEKCFIKFFSNKRNRSVFVKNSDGTAGLIRDVQDALLRLIQKDMILSMKIGCLVKNQDGDDLSRKDDFILIVKEHPQEVKIMLSGERQHCFSGIFSLSAAQKGHTKVYGGGNGFPIIDRLARNVKKYGMLSSKGQEI